MSDRNEGMGPAFNSEIVATSKCAVPSCSADVEITGECLHALTSMNHILHKMESDDSGNPPGERRNTRRLHLNEAALCDRCYGIWQESMDERTRQGNAKNLVTWNQFKNDWLYSPNKRDRIEAKFLSAVRDPFYRSLMGDWVSFKKTNESRAKGKSTGFQA